MNFEKYSKSEFDKLSTEDARVLSDAIQEEVLLELDATIKNAFKEIIDRFNEVGHTLTLYDESAGDIAYRDTGGLRLAIDSIISSGFNDTVDYEPLKTESEESEPLMNSDTSLFSHSPTFLANFTNR